MSNTYEIRSKATWLETEELILLEFRRWKVNEYSIRRDKNAAVVRWFPLGSDDSIELHSGDQNSAANNLRKLFYIIKELRGLEMRGFSQIARNYYLQLPAGEPDPYEVLGVRKDASLTAIEGAWKASLREAHPDRAGGDTEKAARINRAWEAIKADRAVGAK